MENKKVSTALLTALACGLGEGLGTRCTTRKSGSIAQQGQLDKYKADKKRKRLERREVKG